MTQFNPWAELLEQEPKTAYFSRSNQFGGSPRQANYYQNSFNNLYEQYLGHLGSQVRAGMTPVGNWNDYLGGFDFDKWYRQQVPYQQRTEGYSQFVPQVRWRIPGIND